MLPDEYHSPFPGLAEALEQASPVSVRVNLTKGIAVPAEAEAVPWCPSGFWLAERQQFTWDPSLHQGLYYVQDASSMIAHWAVGRAVELVGGDYALTLLDACAAPGGKTTAAIDALPAGSLVVANEYVAPRAAVLAENVAKWGSPTTIVTRGDTSRIAKLREAFDIVVADVPCSGEGMFRKEPEAVRQWSPALVAECAERQRAILANLWKSLRHGGILVYSTCTFNRAENEEILAWLLATLPEATHIALDLPASWGTITTDGCTHFVPGHVRGEGQTLFMAAKGEPSPRHHAPQPAAASPSSASRSRQRQASRIAANTKCRHWLDTPDDYRFEQGDDGRIVALPAQWSDTIRALSASLCVVAAGVEVATVKGRDAIPTQQLALSTALRRQAFPQVEVAYAEAIAYLRREAVTLPATAPRGFVLLTYGNRPLGFVKNLGTRANNLYPAPWRILSTHAPAAPPMVLR